MKYGCTICENDEFGLYWLYLQKFSPFSPFLACKLLPKTIKLPTNCKTLKFAQQNQQGFPKIRNSRRNLLVQNILLEKWQMGLQPTYIPPASLPPPYGM